MIGEVKAKQVFVKQEQGEIQQVFRGWEGQPNFICFDRSKQVFVNKSARKSKRGEIKSAGEGRRAKTPIKTQWYKPLGVDRRIRKAI